MPHELSSLSNPPISDDLLAYYARSFTPLCRVDGELHWMEIPELRKTAFTWAPKPKGKAPNLAEMARIRTLHSFGHPVFFKPSIAEVLAQIPAAYLDQLVGFETLGPDESIGRIEEREAINAGFHVATTILYRYA